MGDEQAPCAKLSLQMTNLSSRVGSMNPQQVYIDLIHNSMHCIHRNCVEKMAATASNGRLPELRSASVPSLLRETTRKSRLYWQKEEEAVSLKTAMSASA